MAMGPGKYDEAASVAFKSTKSESLVLIVIDGDKGNGFEVNSTDPMFQLQLPELLRHVADKIDEDLTKGIKT